MYCKNIKGHTLYWQCGKNQKGYRTAYIPDYALQELIRYKEETKTSTEKLFGITSETYRRHMSTARRTILNKNWRIKVSRLYKNQVTEHEYMLETKGIRKSFATFIFSRYWKKYGSADTAMLMTSKEMNHSSKHMTSRHYIEDADRTKMIDYINENWHDLFNINISWEEYMKTRVHSYRTKKREINYGYIY